MFFLIFFLINIFSIDIEAESKRKLEQEIKLIDSFDINDKDNIYSLLNDLEGTSIIVKIKDKNKKNIGVFKTDSGNNIAQGEFAMFKLSYLINFNIYPASKLLTLNIASLKKVKALLEEVKFEKFYGKKHIPHMKAKEKNRKTMINNIDNLIKENKPLNGVFKAWVNNLQFYLALGTINNFKKHKIFKYMNIDSKILPNDPFIIEQCTKLLKPLGCTYGNTFLNQLAKDMSTILVIDSIFNNRDRFPGGNLHFYSIDDKITVKDEKTRTYLNARLFSLDNGAVLKDTKYSNTKILEDLNISKFVQAHINALLKLRNNKDLQNILQLDNQHFEILINNYDNTLKYIKNLEQIHNNKVWFN